VNYEVRSSTPMFPKPHEINFGIGDAKEQISVFSQRVVVFIPMAMNGSSGQGEVPIKVKVSYQACDDKQCLFPTPVHWTYFTPERLNEAMAQEKAVVLEFTAAWCLNCHALEQTVLHNPRVVEALNSSGVSPIKVDITGRNPAGDRKLMEVGRRTIPYLVVYSTAGKEVFSSDAYSVEQLLAAIQEAQKSP